MLTEPEVTRREHDKRSVTWWQPGQSGNPAGRPKSSRSKLSEDFVEALQRDFSHHGEAAITRMREDDSSTYCKLIGSLVPRDVNLNVSAAERFGQIITMIENGTANALVASPGGVEGGVNNIAHDDIPSITTAYRHSGADGISAIPAKSPSQGKKSKV